MRLKLAIEPIPQSTWGKSLANLMPKKEWDELRHKAYKEADYWCEVCGETSLPLHLHERWAYRKVGKTSGIQRLVGFVCLCELCHDSVHLGRSIEVKSKAYVERLMKHLEKINGISRAQLLVYLDEVKRVNYDRAKRYWRVKVGNRYLA